MQENVSYFNSGSVGIDTKQCFLLPTKQVLVVPSVSEHYAEGSSWNILFTEYISF